MIRTIFHAPSTRREVLKGGLSAAAMLAAGLHAAPSNAQDAGAPKSGGVLKVAFSADPAGFDPLSGPSGMSQVVNEQIYSTLMSLDQDANPYPDLAERYEMSADGLTYTFYLRKGVKFHNGDGLTAEDVKFSFDRLRAPNSGYSYGAQVETIASIDVVDPYTVKFTLSKPTGPFLINMAFPGSAIVPKKAVEGGLDLSSHPIGSGPFRFVSYTPRSKVVFEKNPEYYEAGKPYFDGLEFDLIADQTALTNAVLSGTVDFSNELPPKDWATVQATPGLVGTEIEGSRFYWLLPNQKRKPFQDPRVRQAIGHALNRTAIVAGAFFGLATPIVGGTIPKWNWAYADIEYFKPEGDPEKAKQLLAAAGYPDGFNATFTAVASFPAMVAMAPIIQANLAAIGIQATISSVEVPRYWDEVWGPSNFDMTTMYWVSPLADPDDFVTNNYKCNMPTNKQNSCSTDMDALLEKAKTATTQEERKALYKQQQQLSLDEMGIVPVVNASILIAHTDKLQNFKPLRTASLKPLRDTWFSV